MFIRDDVKQRSGRFALPHQFTVCHHRRHKILDAYAIENQISLYQDEIDVLMEQEEKTGGDPERFEKATIALYEKSVFCVNSCAWLKSRQTQVTR